MKVHLVDGTYELFRMHFGAPPARAADGSPAGAVRGLLRSFAAMLREDDVTHVAVAFDHVIESFRNDLFAGYKTGDGIEPELRAQFEPAERATAALGVVLWPMVEFEADDALATAARRFAAESAVEQVVICSPDKDLGQCVEGDRIVQLDRRRRQLFAEPQIIEKFGVAPRAIPDYLALVGDSADGIPGIPRWGAKSAAQVLAHYGSIDAIPDDDGDWAVKVRGAKALASNLREQRAEARLYRTLATLRFDVPLAESLTDLEWRGGRRDELTALCGELGEDDLLERIPRFS